MNLQIQSTLQKFTISLCRRRVDQVMSQELERKKKLAGLVLYMFVCVRAYVCLLNLQLHNGMLTILQVKCRVIVLVQHGFKVELLQALDCSVFLFFYFYFDLYSHSLIFFLSNSGLILFKSASRSLSLSYLVLLFLMSRFLSFSLIYSYFSSLRRFPLYIYFFYSHFFRYSNF